MSWGDKRRLVVLSIFALIFLAPFLHATQNCTATTWYDSSLYIWVGLSILIASAFIGLAYMVAKALELQVLEAWVKLEVNELIAGMVIAVFCVALLASVNGAAQFLSGDTSSSPTVICTAQNFLKDTLYDDGKYLYTQLANAYFPMARIASYSYTTGLSVSVVSFGLSQSPAGGLSYLVSAVGQAMDSVANFMLLAASEYSFLSFFNTATVIMLPVGIFLRSFSLTRKIGGVVLAGVITVAVIYPVGVLLAKEIYQYFRLDMINDASLILVRSAPNPPTVNLVCSPFMQIFVASPLPFVGGETGWYLTIGIPLCTALAAVSFGAGFQPCMELVKKIVQIIFIIIKALFPILTFFLVFLPFSGNLQPNQLLIDYYDPIQQHALPAVAKFSVLSLLVFLIPIIVTIVMLRNLTLTFGGEPQLYGLSKLV